MPTVHEHSVVTRTANDTQQLGYDIGIRLNKATVLRLSGELGSGKTCLVQGLAKGLEVPEGFHITSPTYALVHDYPGRIPLVHVDLYRIQDESDAESIGLWELIDQQTVVAVEWANRLSDTYWPATSLVIDIKMHTDDTRRVHLIGYGLQMADLVMEISQLAPH